MNEWDDTSLELHHLKAHARLSLTIGTGRGGLGGLGSVDRAVVAQQPRALQLIDNLNLPDTSSVPTSFGLLTYLAFNLKQFHISLSKLGDGTLLRWLLLFESHVTFATVRNEASHQLSVYGDNTPENSAL
jgi:hypothetical protein